jgi:hypothetical protein
MSNQPSRIKIRVPNSQHISPSGVAFVAVIGVVVVLAIKEVVGAVLPSLALFGCS